MKDTVSKIGMDDHWGVFNICGAGIYFILLFCHFIEVNRGQKC